MAPDRPRDAQAIAQLAGLQAQAPRAPYVGLQARLARFRPEHLENLLTERAVLRAHLMRNTVHLVETADYLRFRPLYQPSMDRALAGHWGRHPPAPADLADAPASPGPDVPAPPRRRVTAPPAAHREAIAAEGERLLAFAGPAAGPSDVRFVGDGE